ncbi:MAG: hypothetical protein ACTHJ8_14540 [Mucilaginibacter sp.]
MLFVAKPFFGFSAFNQQTKPRISHTILVKSFTKRKPESLQDADASAEAVSQKVANPLLVVLSAISLLISITLPLIFGVFTKITGKIIADIHFRILPPGQAYLLTGKLTI